MRYINLRFIYLLTYLLHGVWLMRISLLKTVHGSKNISVIQSGSFSSHSVTAESLVILDLCLMFKNEAVDTSNFTD